MMKSFLLFTWSVALATISFSQNPNAKPAPKVTVVPKPVLKDLRDSASYAMGIFFMNAFKQQGIENINSAAVARAINDMQANKPTLLNDNAANHSFTMYKNKLQALKSKPNIDAGMKFMSDNRKKPGVKYTPSGLQYEIIKEGTGPKPVLGDSVTCNYIGTYVNGIEFDRGQPITFSTTGVITGWTEALLMMPTGSKWKLYVPYQLGYGPADYNGIPGGSVLIFDLELLSVKSK
jgi:FKBP-type peptidyl-prolyl cis-trans isomerase